MIVIFYTTRYRQGGRRFAQAARTLADQLRSSHGPTVVVRATESKADVRALLKSAAEISELHFIGHAGLYGPMFGTTRWPEQFSPYEWRTLTIPFAPGARAYFHACRSARWFAPFFARTFRVRTFGFHWYTAFSTRRDRFSVVAPWHPEAAPLFVAGCPGKTSHGATGTLRKYAGRVQLEQPRGFDPDHGGGSYDPVADAYDAAFDDIGVRHDELRWLRAHLPPGPLDILDIGCGNGALLQKLAARVRSGVGVDASARMIELARQRNAAAPRLRFEQVDTPSLPLPDQSIDVAISMLSFRYLDWDPLMLELQRVLRADGRLLVIDMVDKPAGVRQWPRVLVDKARATAAGLRRPGYTRARKRLVSSRQWSAMLRFNPMRAFHEYDWYLGSRFPRGSLSVLNVGRRAQVIAYDSGPFSTAHLTAMSYP